jgi:hypothetical protein
MIKDRSSTKMALCRAGEFVVTEIDAADISNRAVDDGQFLMVSSEEMDPQEAIGVSHLDPNALPLKVQLQPSRVPAFLPQNLSEAVARRINEMVADNILRDAINECTLIWGFSLSESLSGFAAGLIRVKGHGLNIDRFLGGADVCFEMAPEFPRVHQNF